MLEIKRVEEKEVELLAQTASQVWHEYFPCILSLEQIDYMVEKFQSKQAIENQLKEGYEYYFLNVDGAVGGYICLKEYPDYLFLSKFYILKDFRSKGYGRKAFEFMVNRAKEAGLNKIRVSVNKYNSSSIKVYEKFGFVCYNAVVQDIGNGFVMDDYGYECQIK
ncbi:MAG: GNAT family N-acetyltransferase [Clostridia bacterium]|nr:GNAT family N-acetyltransferase [Clostridia bacterium]